MRRVIFTAWNFIFDHEKSPLRHIPDFSVRHMVFQMLGWMWSIVFALATGSYLILGVSLLGHAILIAALAITAATYAAAMKQPEMFLIRVKR
jgi:hypothetical protein